MTEAVDKIIRIARDELKKVLGEKVPQDIDVEEIEELRDSGHFTVTLAYWSRDNRPSDLPENAVREGAPGGRINLFNPWRRKYKRVEIDPATGKAVSIRMYEPPLGVS